MRARESGSLGALEALRDVCMEKEMVLRREDCTDVAGTGLRQKQGLYDRMLQRPGFKGCCDDSHYLCAFHGTGRVHRWIRGMLVYERALLRALGIGILLYYVVVIMRM